MDDISQTAVKAARNLGKHAAKTAVKPPRKAACRRLPVTATAEQRRDAHCAKMQMKRRRDAELGTGFMSVPNKRITAALGVAELAIITENLRLGRTESPAEIQDKALRRVAATLPRPRMVRPVRFRPTKNDDPAYRNGGVRTAAERRWAAVS